MNRGLKVLHKPHKRAYGAVAGFDPMNRGLKVID